MTLQNGTVVGDRYRILSLRANGASGSVYEAEHEGLNKTVALKVVHASLSGTQLVGRFFREARILTTLDHPNIVRALDVGVDPVAGAFMALEYVEGEDLESRLAREPRLEVSQALRIAHDIAVGVASVHSARIIHRDLKPANVLIERGTGKAKVTDFGVARIRDDLRQLDLNGSVTEFEMAVGTPQYMAPEQVGAPHEVDDRTDVFALGAILYEMLAGRPAFDTPRLERIMRDVLLRKAPSVGACGVPLPPNIINLVDAMLSPAPEFRPKSIREVALELENVFAVKRSVPPPALAPPAPAVAASDVASTGEAPKRQRPALVVRVPTPANAQEPIDLAATQRDSSDILAPLAASSFPPLTTTTHEEEARTERAPFVEVHRAQRRANIMPASAYVAMVCLALGGFALGRTTLPRADAHGAAGHAGVLLPEPLPPALGAPAKATGSVIAEPAHAEPTQWPSLSASAKPTASTRPEPPANSAQNQANPSKSE